MIYDPSDQSRPLFFSRSKSNMKLLDKDIFFSHGLELEEITAADKGESQFSEELMSRLELELDREPSPQLVMEEADWIAESK